METVLILGATSDIGIAIAKKFAAQKYNIQLAARKAEQLVAIKSDIEIRYNVECTAHEFDAIHYHTHTSFFENLNPKPDITISIFGAMYEEDNAFDEWDLTQMMINVNYTGVVSILNIAAKFYTGRKKGTIIGISSVAGDRGRASKLIYGSSKAALSAYLDGLRNKCFKDNVHVMTVKPGFVYTRMTENLPLPKALTSTPDEVADIIYSAFKSKKNTIYIKWFWRYIMLIIKNIPEFQFKKMKL
ncbi:SDR family oxidoreductase [Mucilaginibacter xinganensis]|uniref:Serine 3-dehydrogenase n=1 Tax=Mucilaginibacter xinganensis TaxID=1234841 RepID=A0A223NZB8_9SPHI|nr:SDR family oxidoreductase [Mucilaginibacter xinganensis]ASU35120.1 Serine 3-dehydrogenase [Mucilaginibacter xinganensis]